MCFARSQWRSAAGSCSCCHARTASRPATLVAGVSPSIHISRKYGKARAPCNVNNQLRMLVGNKNQQMRDQHGIEAHRDQIVAPLCEDPPIFRLDCSGNVGEAELTGHGLIVLPAELVCCRCRGSAQMHERSSVCGRLLSISQAAYT